MSYLFNNCPFDGNISTWCIDRLVEYEWIFNRFDDSPLGYLGVLLNEQAFPDRSRAVRFKELKSLCAGLDMSPVDTATFIFETFHQPELNISVGAEFNFL